MEPWDGPSALVFTDGRLLGAALDRNGLRPCRYVITDTGLIVAGSEVGLADVSPDSIVRSGRLGPGQMILLDLERSELLDGEALDRYFDELTTYTTLIDDIPLEPAQEPVAALPEDEVTRLQRGFGYTREDLKMVIAPMALEGKEATWSMGDDTPIAPLARTPRPLYGFFRQRFAQVTNPAIDSSARVMRGFAAHAAWTLAALARQARSSAWPGAAFAISVAGTDGSIASDALSDARGSAAGAHWIAPSRRTILCRARLTACARARLNWCVQGLVSCC